MPQASNPCWRFSLRVYRIEGVAQACLALQDRHGADVNLLLWCGWVGRAGRTLERRRLRQAMQRVRVWQSEVVAPLRAARRSIKQHAPVGLDGPLAQRLRQRIARVEIELERVEQQLLYDLAAPWPEALRPQPPGRTIVTNIGRYLALLGAALSPADARCVATLCDACAGATTAGRR